MKQLYQQKNIQRLQKDKYDLQSLIDSLPGKKLNEISAIKYCKDVAEGLHQRHKNNEIVTYLNLKNIFINENKNAVEFEFDQTHPQASGNSMGNDYFQAPECCDPTVFKEYYDEYQKRKIQTDTEPSQRSNACSLGYIFYVMVQGVKPDLTSKKQLELQYDQNFETFKYKKQLRYIIDGLTKFDPMERLPVEEVLILLKGIISFELDLEKFVDSQETQEQANQQKIECIQNFSKQQFPIFKDEDSFPQGQQPNPDEIETLRDYSKFFENQINCLKETQVQAESKIQGQDKIIEELQTQIAKRTQEICINNLYD